jgi:hypothetical protein
MNYPGKTQNGDKVTTPGDWAEFIMTEGSKKSGPTRRSHLVPKGRGRSTP